jgi:hypothetical protein
LLEVTGIGDDGRELLELIECGSHVEPSRRTGAMVQSWRLPQRRPARWLRSPELQHVTLRQPP